MNRDKMTTHESSPKNRKGEVKTEWAKGNCIFLYAGHIAVNSLVLVI